MTRILPTPMQRERRRAGLNQREVALLVGVLERVSISRYERCHRTPSLKTAFACQYLFQVPLNELFPEVYAEVELDVTQQAHRLVALLKKQKSTARNDYKIRQLLAVIARGPDAPKLDI